jgi:hypothetical protein
MTKNIDAQSSRGRRSLFRLLAVAWGFTAAAMVLFSWTAAGGYQRIALTQDRTDSERAIAACRVLDCDPEPAGLVTRQWLALDRMQTVVQVSAWSITIAAAIILLVATVLVFDRLPGDARRFLSIAWKVQAGVAALLLAAQLYVLVGGSRNLADIPDAARTVPTITTFDSPLTDVGNLYYFAWYLGVAVIGTILTRALRDAVARVRLTPGS